MIEIMLSKFLSRPFDEMKRQSPFNQWKSKREVDEDSEPPEVMYTFSGGALEVHCNLEDCITSIFLKKESYKGNELSPVCFKSRRADVIKAMGQKPSFMGDAEEDDILGPSGPWLRFDSKTICIHVQFEYDSDSIEMITLMSPEVAP